MSQMLKSSGAMATATFASRILGLGREMAYAQFMGTGWIADAFILAFMIPNLFRRLLGEGALTAAFIPIFKEKEKLAGPGEMWRAASAVLSALILSVTILVALGILGISIALLFGNFSGKTQLMLELLRVMSPYLLLVCVAATFMGMLNARGHFFLPAFGAGLLNVVMIASVFLLAPRMGARLETQIFGLAIGVLLAGVVQAGFQWPLLRKEGFRFDWLNPWPDETVHRVARQMIPGAIGVAAFQINILLTQGMAFWVGSGVVSSFNYAVRLMELPQGLFGISLATYLLPTLSGLAAEKKFPEFRATLAQGLNYLIFINLIASVLLCTMAEPIIRLLFERRRFDASDTLAASSALVYLAPGLVAFSMVNILARAFYATGDTRTPMRISVFCLALNAVFVLGLIWHFKQAGLAMANTMSAAVNVTLLLYALRRKLGRLELGALRASLWPMLAAGVVAAFIAWTGHAQWETHLGHRNLWLKLGEVFGPMTAAAAAYGAISLWAGVEPARDIWHAAMSRFKAGQ